MTQRVSLGALLGATHGVAVSTGATSFAGVSIDGRSLRSGELWFAIRGQRDGHAFAAQAVARGAAGVVIERGRARELGLPPGITLVEVEDTVRALGALGRARRLALPSLRVVGITGSNGKTTTKELVAGILAAQVGAGRVHKTEGNFNNHLGLPLTLLGLDEEHRYAVIEMGMSARGEIAYLASLACPDVGVVVNVGPVHLETLGTIAEVTRAKGELLRALPPAGVAIIPDGNEGLAQEAAASRAVRQLRFGARPGVHVHIRQARVTREGTEVELRLPDGGRSQARLAVVGLHNADNAAAAAAVGYALGVDAATISLGLGQADVAKHRSTLVDIGGRHVLDDCYNASPLSTGAALDTLASLRGNNVLRGAGHLPGGNGLPAGPAVVAVLGEMLELGPQADELHRELGARAAERGVDRVFAFGPHADDVVDGARRAGMSGDCAQVAADVESLVASIVAVTRPGDWILVKGSRGMKLERVLDGLRLQLDAQEGV